MACVNAYCPPDNAQRLNTRLSQLDQVHDGLHVKTKLNFSRLAQMGIGFGEFINRDGKFVAPAKDNLFLDISARFTSLGGTTLKMARTDINLKNTLTGLGLPTTYEDNVRVPFTEKCDSDTNFKQCNNAGSYIDPGKRQYFSLSLSAITNWIKEDDVTIQYIAYNNVVDVYFKIKEVTKNTFMYTFKDNAIQCNFNLKVTWSSTDIQSVDVFKCGNNVKNKIINALTNTDIIKLLLKAKLSGDLIQAVENDNGILGTTDTYLVKRCQLLGKTCLQKVFQRDDEEYGGEEGGDEDEEKATITGYELHYPPLDPAKLIHAMYSNVIDKNLKVIAIYNQIPDHFKIKNRSGDLSITKTQTLANYFKTLIANIGMINTKLETLRLAANSVQNIKQEKLTKLQNDLRLAEQTPLLFMIEETKYMLDPLANKNINEIFKRINNVFRTKCDLFDAPLYRILDMSQIHLQPKTKTKRQRETFEPSKRRVSNDTVSETDQNNKEPTAKISAREENAVNNVFNSTTPEQKPEANGLIMQLIKLYWGIDVAGNNEDSVTIIKECQRMYNFAINCWNDVEDFDQFGIIQIGGAPPDETHIISLTLFLIYVFDLIGVCIYDKILVNNWLVVYQDNDDIYAIQKGIYSETIDFLGSKINTMYDAVSKKVGDNDYDNDCRPPTGEDGYEYTSDWCKQHIDYLQKAMNTLTSQEQFNTVAEMQLPPELQKMLTLGPSRGSPGSPGSPAASAGGGTSIGGSILSKFGKLSLKVPKNTKAIVL